MLVVLRCRRPIVECTRGLGSAQQTVEPLRVLHQRAWYAASASANRACALNKSPRSSSAGIVGAGVTGAFGVDASSSAASCINATLDSVCPPRERATRSARAEARGCCARTVPRPTCRSRLPVSLDAAMALARLGDSPMCAAPRPLREPVIASAHAKRFQSSVDGLARHDRMLRRPGVSLERITRAASRPDETRS